MKCSITKKSANDFARDNLADAISYRPRLCATRRAATGAVDSPLIRLANLRSIRHNTTLLSSRSCAAFIVLQTREEQEEEEALEKSRGNVRLYRLLAR